ncbi:MAG: FIST N-terminal domain-containing protein [Candidatus Omnitrophota bacterium]|nr:FIST N-terminal domain-containing protein [Candidatus Omnitrophota bacterium]
MQVGIGFSENKDYVEAAKEAVSRAKAHMAAEEEINLAIVFSTVEFSHTLLFKTIIKFLGEEVTIIGSSSQTVIANQLFLKYGLVIMLLSFPEKIYFKTALLRGISAKSAKGIGEELAEKLITDFKNINRKLCITFCAGLIQNTSDLIDGMENKFGKGFPLMGASLADNLSFQKTYLYFGREVYTDSACGILWGGNLNFGLGLKHGWKPLGKSRFVTSSFRNTVNEIDHAPAARVYEECFAKEIPGLIKDLKYISRFYPVGMYLEKEKEYLLRSIISIRNNGSLVFQGDIPEGSRIRFMIGTKESILLAVEQASRQAKQEMLGRKVNFVLVFDSISRQMLLGKQIYKELEIIQGQFGKDTPVIGLCTYAELAPLRSGDYLGKVHSHNQTITILAIGEQSEVKGLDLWSKKS